MAVKISYNNGTTQTYHEGRVLSRFRTTVRVSSDHAMIDSGNRVGVYAWDDEKFRVVKDLYRTDDMLVEVEADATDAARALADKYDKMAKWFNATQESYARLAGPVQVYYSRQLRQFVSNLRPGDPVEISGSRKAPQGLYEVVRTGHNDYGSYVHVRNAAEAEYRYINPAHLRRPAPTDARLREAAGDPKGDFGALVVGALVAGNNAGNWLVACDWLRDHNRDDDARILEGLVRARFAPTREAAGAA
jgi:hypothetical protein